MSRPGSHRSAQALWEGAHHRTDCEEAAPRHHGEMERDLTSSLSLGKKRDALRLESWIITMMSSEIKRGIAIFSTVYFKATSVT